MSGPANTTNVRALPVRRQGVVQTNANSAQRPRPTTSICFSEPARQALNDAWFALLKGEAALFVGEAGVGKTLLACELLRRMPESVRSLYVAAPEFGQRSLLTRVQESMMMAWRQHVRGGADQSKAQQWVVVIDDAQRLDVLTLARIGEIRQQAIAAGLSVGLLLVGRSTLEQVVTQPTLKRLAAQLTTRCSLQPCSYQDTRTFIRHWLQANRAIGIGHSDSAGRIIYYATRGVPRQIEQVCRRALDSVRTRGGRTVSALAAARATWNVL